MEQLEEYYTGLYNQCNVSDLEDANRYASPISAIRITTSILSIIGSTSIIIAVFLTGKLSNMEIHPLFTLSVGDFVLSCMWLFGGSLWFESYRSRHDEIHHGIGLCYILAISTTVINMVTSLLTIVYAFHAFMQMRQIAKAKGKVLVTRSYFHHIMTGLVYLIAWCLPLVLVIPVTETQVGLKIANNACWCFIDFFNTRPGGGPGKDESDDLATIIAIYSGLTFLVSSIAIIVFYSATLWMAWKVLKHQRMLNSDIKSRKVIKKLAIRAAAFIGIYFICGIPFLAGAIDVLRERVPLQLLEKPDQVILFWQALFGPLQGFLNALVYGWSRKEFRRFCSVPLMRLRSRWCVRDSHVLLDSTEEHSYYH